MIHFRLPNINGKTEEERMKQVIAFLYQLVQELNWAMEALSKEGGK